MTRDLSKNVIFIKLMFIYYLSATRCFRLFLQKNKTGFFVFTEVAEVENKTKFKYSSSIGLYLLVFQQLFFALICQKGTLSGSEKFSIIEL